MTKEHIILAVSFIAVNIVIYLAMAFIHLSLSPGGWSETTRFIYGFILSSSFIGVVYWILFKPEE